MKPEFTIERHGKTYVLFAGLLDEAHQNGLRGIGIEEIQLPTPENGNVAVMKATVEMEDGRTFSEIGDASPENVGRNIVPHIIRMAATRAKARALRDAVNVGVTALEELSDGDGSPSQAPRTSAKPRNMSSSQSQGSDSQQEDRESMPATDKQIGFLTDKIEKSDDWETIREWEESHKPIKTLTRGEASKAINAL